MNSIHFTQAATDPLIGFGAKRGSFGPLAEGEIYISCLHLEKGAAVLALLIVEADRLTADRKGMSTPQRINGATWPSHAIQNSVKPQGLCTTNPSGNFASDCCSA